MKNNFSKHPLYSRWLMMVNRCLNIKSNDFNNYGGRGILIQNSWHPPTSIGFVNFINDMIVKFPEILDDKGYFKSELDIIGYFNSIGENSSIFKAAPRISIDRINNDGNYEIENIRWASRGMQNHNRRAASLKISRGLPIGVRYKKVRRIYESYYNYTDELGNSKFISLGYSKCLFDAVCLRKSWESDGYIHE